MIQKIKLYGHIYDNSSDTHVAILWITLYEVAIICVTLFSFSVFFRRREAEVYPDDYENKPEVGEELNKPSEITLYKIWPNDKTSHTPVKVFFIF